MSHVSSVCFFSSARCPATRLAKKSLNKPPYSTITGFTGALITPSSASKSRLAPWRLWTDRRIQRSRAAPKSEGKRWRNRQNRPIIIHKNSQWPRAVTSRSPRPRRAPCSYTGSLQCKFNFAAQRHIFRESSVDDSSFMRTGRRRPSLVLWPSSSRAKPCRRSSTNPTAVEAN
jgi:hypothetical protein